MPKHLDIGLCGEKLSHACIIASVSAHRREEAAISLAAAMVCSGEGKKPCKVCKNCRKAEAGIHPDIIIVDKASGEKKGKSGEIYVDQVRAVVSDAYILPNEADKKVYIIKDADKMNKGAQNAVLKLLEEPPSHVALVLCASNAGGLLDTIRSRCVELIINAEEAEPEPECLSLAEEYLSITAAGDDANLIRFCFANEKMEAAQAAGFIECVQMILTDILCERLPSIGLDRQQMMKMTRLMNKALEYLRFNVGVKHVFGMIAAGTL